jgi:spermidine/putrescine transport system substrate-binding protein
MVFHPRDPRYRTLSRRDFLRRSLASGVTFPTAAALLAACEGEPPAPPDEGGEDAVPRFGTLENPVTLQTYDDNVPIDSKLEPEVGPLVIYNWNQYFWKAVLKSFGKKYGVDVRYETFNSMERAIEKIQTGEVTCDIFFPTIDYLPKMVAEKLVQPLNHDYLPSTKNVWPSLRDPYYDRKSQYSLPYTIYTTGFGWRTDILSVEPADLDAMENPYEVFWHPDMGASIPGKVGIYDAYREALSLGLYRDHGAEANLNTSDPAQIESAKQHLLELIELVDVETTIDGAYSGIPEGRFGLHQSWSGDMQATPWYTSNPQEEAGLMRYYWPAREGHGGTIDNDLYAIPKDAKNPVLAHRFLNFMMDELNAIKNWTWVGYQVPFTAVNSDTIFERSYPGLEGWFVWDYKTPGDTHWNNLKSTIVTPEDFEIGKRAIGLRLEVDNLWQDAYQDFKSG